MFTWGDFPIFWIGKHHEEPIENLRNIKIPSYSFPLPPKEKNEPSRVYA